MNIPCRLLTITSLKKLPGLRICYKFDELVKNQPRQLRIQYVLVSRIIIYICSIGFALLLISWTFYESIKFKQGNIRMLNSYFQGKNIF